MGSCDFSGESLVSVFLLFQMFQEGHSLFWYLLDHDHSLFLMFENCPKVSFIFADGISNPFSKSGFDFVFYFL